MGNANEAISILKESIFLFYFYDWLIPPGEPMKLKCPTQLKWWKPSMVLRILTTAFLPLETSIIVYGLNNSDCREGDAETRVVPSIALLA